MGAVRPLFRVLNDAEDSAPPHSRDESFAAINQLSCEDYYKLLRFAGWIARGKVGVVDAGDLLQESIRATLEPGRRNWPKSIDIITHLRGCIRSLAHSWRKQTSHEREGQSQGSVPSGEQRLLDVEQINGIRDLFSGDTLSRNVLECLMQGESRKDGSARLGIPQNVYDACIKKIRRRIEHSAFAKGGFRGQ